MVPDEHHKEAILSEEELKNMTRLMMHGLDPSKDGEIDVGEFIAACASNEVRDALRHQISLNFATRVPPKDDSLGNKMCSLGHNKCFQVVIYANWKKVSKRYPCPPFSHWE